MFSDYVIDSYELGWFPKGSETGCSYGFYIGNDKGLKGEPKLLVEKNDEFFPVSIENPVFSSDVTSWISLNKKYLLNYWYGNIEFWDLIDFLKAVE